MVNYVCGKTVLDSTKLCLIKGSKSKFPRGTCPRTSLVCQMLSTWICTCHLGKKLKETLVLTHMHYDLGVHVLYYKQCK